MQISPIKPNIKGINTPKKQSFGSFLCVDRVSHCTLDSAFFRGNGILRAVINNLEKNFPDGAEVLDYACSNGEEAISILAQLKNRFKYPIRAFDVSSVALTQAKTGIHSVFSGFYDSYLLRESRSNEKSMLRSLFLSVMQPINKPDVSINSSKFYTKLSNKMHDFKEEYFKVQDKYITTIDYSKGDIRDLGTLKTERPVGAILFRNAFYHLCNNKILEILAGKSYLTPSANKVEVAENIVNNVYHKLDKGGIFAIGNHYKDNIFIADKNISLEQTVKFKDTIFYNEDYADAGDTLFMKKSPIVAALAKDGKFSPVHYSYVIFLDNIYKYPTVWQKV